MNEFESNIHEAKKHIYTLLDRERSKEPATTLDAAICIAAKCQATSKEAKGAEPVTRKERAQFNEQVKRQEAEAIRQWARQNGLWIQDEIIRKLASQYVAEGAEQKVYLKENGRAVIKINTGIFHGTWMDFFIRLILHKAIFPSTAYELKGFIEAESQLCALIEQPWVQVARGATTEEVKGYLTPLGFTHLKRDDYYHREHGIILEDLHDENVFIGSENNLLFVDPVIYLQTPDMKLIGGTVFRFPFH
jgi:hypothetical protein